MYILITNEKFLLEFHCQDDELDSKIDSLLKKHNGFKLHMVIPDYIREFKLKSRDIYWSPDSKAPEIIDNVSGNNTSIPDLLYLISELDRRLIQLWDKVAFENKHGLVDYSNFKRQSNDT